MKIIPAALGFFGGGLLFGIIGAIASVGTSVLLPGLGLIIAGPIIGFIFGALVGAIIGGIAGLIVGAMLSPKHN